MNHELKIEESYFEAVQSGDKTFEIRYNDRGFQKGDIVVLEEVSGHSCNYTGRKLTRQISYVSNYSQKDNWVVFGIIEIEEKTNREESK